MGGCRRVSLVDEGVLVWGWRRVSAVDVGDYCDGSRVNVVNGSGLARWIHGRVVWRM